MKINFFKKGKDAGKKTFKPKLVGEDRARHDWMMMVAVFVVLILIVISFDFYLFTKINRGDFFATDGEIQDNETVATKKVLLDAQNFFETRQKEYEAFKSTPPVEIDPSI
jgi:hypothetical protein